MKKILIVLVALAIASPAWAGSLLAPHSQPGNPKSLLTPSTNEEAARQHNVMEYNHYQQKKQESLIYQPDYRNNQNNSIYGPSNNNFNPYNSDRQF